MGRNRTAIAPPGSIQTGVASTGAEDFSEPSGKKVISTAPSVNQLDRGLRMVEAQRFRGDQDTLLRAAE